MATKTKSTQTVLDDHLEAFGNGDLDAILADYADDALIVTNTGGTYRGHDGLVEFFTGLFEEFSQEGSEVSMEHTQVEGDVAYIVWNASTPDNAYEFVTDTFVIEDGKIVTQTLGAVVTPQD